MSKSTMTFDSNKASKKTGGEPTVKINFEISEELAIKLDKIAKTEGLRMNFMARKLFTEALNNN